ncbi:FecR family protein [uncultured Alistipes sp.]|uniref:FecR family protein n=1 Tax=uncultured Alistipes sp. TaxID=538949 RepID=UPI0025E44AC4|nr:FecR family protein [uncultured Alistipes sp.]
MTKLTLDTVRDYFYGRCNSSEEVRIQQWFAENHNKAEADSLLNSLLDEVQTENPALAQEAFERFCRRIGHPVPMRAAPRRLATVIRWTQRCAAILIVPLIIAVSMLYTKTSNLPEWEEMIVPAGQRSELRLADGTLLWLNSGTRVTYPSHFNGRQRKIFVDGEVYAEVMHDQRHPFIISSGDVEVKVLGTKFNMRAYNTDQLVEVALVEGSVLFDVNSDKCDDNVVMLRNDIAQYDRLTGELEVNSFQSDNYKSRARGGGFYFFNESLEGISAQLARCFNRKIIISDPELSDVRFYAFFTNNESLLKILNTLNADSSMSIREAGEVIYISRKR